MRTLQSDGSGFGTVERQDGKSNSYFFDVDKNQEVADKFKIRGVPTFILFKSGEIVWRNSGVIELSRLSSMVEEHL